jgi:hypothetical protein
VTPARHPHEQTHPEPCDLMFVEDLDLDPAVGDNR